MPLATAIAKFRVIGASAKMQTVSWAEEFRLFDGIPYNIDFDQDFSAITFKGQPITDVPVASIFEFLRNPNEAGERSWNCAPSARCTAEEYRLKLEIEKTMKKEVKREEKADKKWKKDKPEREKTRKKFFNWLDEQVKDRKKGW